MCFSSFFFFFFCFCFFEVGITTAAADASHKICCLVVVFFSINWFIVRSKECHNLKRKKTTSKVLSAQGDVSVLPFLVFSRNSVKKSNGIKVTLTGTGEKQQTLPVTSDYVINVTFCQLLHPSALKLTKKNKYFGNWLIGWAAFQELFCSFKSTAIVQPSRRNNSGVGVSGDGSWILASFYCPYLVPSILGGNTLKIKMNGDRHKENQ